MLRPLAAPERKRVSTPRVGGYLLFAKLETRLAVAVRSPSSISAESRLGSDPGPPPTPARARYGAC